MKIKYLWIASAGLLAACVDNAHFCREPGYTCSEHVEKDNSRLCSEPGYTCGGLSNTEPDFGHVHDSSGAGASDDSGN